MVGQLSPPLITMDLEDDQRVNVFYALKHNLAAREVIYMLLYKAQARSGKIPANQLSLRLPSLLIGA